MDARRSPAYAAWSIGLGLVPVNRDPGAVLPKDLKAKFLRALEFIAIADEHPSRAKAARAAHLPWGTVASWIHRDSELREQVSAILTDPDDEPLTKYELESISRVAQLPEPELERISAGADLDSDG